MPYCARIFGTTTAIAFVAIPLGQLVGGYLIEWLGVQTFIAAVAAIYLAVVVPLVFKPVLHEMDHPLAIAPSPAPMHAADTGTQPH